VPVLAGGCFQRADDGADVALLLEADDVRSGGLDDLVDLRVVGIGGPDVPREHPHDTIFRILHQFDSRKKSPCV
jgi:hypothetical protein